MASPNAMSYAAVVAGDNYVSASEPMQPMQQPMQPMQPMQPPVQAYTIIFHGNCIDGWMSTYIAHSVLQRMGPVKMFAVSPNQKQTWPTPEEVTGTHVLLLDISFPSHVRKAWFQGGVRSIDCIDHHESAMEHWAPTKCPIDTSKCAAYLTWQRFYPQLAIPAWLELVDRIDRWDNVTYEDRCMREILNIIAHKPVEGNYEEAFEMTLRFLVQIEEEEGFLAILKEGETILEKKDNVLMEILNKGSVHLFTEEYIKNWQLPNHWLNTYVYLLDTTNVTLDTTEAAHIVFEHDSNVKVFINYRKKCIMGPKGQQELYVYSARSKDFDLTLDNPYLRGHKFSAGASLFKNKVPVLPFVL
jgi:hypothetical protein